MKVTFEIPDTLFDHLTASAALKGQTIDEFIVDAICSKLTENVSEPSRKTGWQAAFGAADPEEVAEVQRIIDEEFSRINLEEW